MSDSLAIAATTAGLAQILANSLASVEPGARTTHLVPASGALATGDPFANLHLLAVEPAAVARAAPRRGSTPAPLLLRLTYFISFHGDQSRLVPQKLMGAVAAGLHAQPLLAGTAEPSRVTQVSLGAERMAALAAALGAPGLSGLVYEVSPVPL